MTEADRLVELWLLREFQRDRSGQPSPLSAVSVTVDRTPRDQGLDHLAACGDATVSAVDHHGIALWDTGVTGVEFTAEIRCPHGESAKLEVMLMGTFADVIEELDGIKAALARS